MKADGAPPIAALRVDGGMAASGIAMQFLADIVPVAVERPASLETTAWGAAYVAGFVRGVCPPPAAMIDGWKAERRFTPTMDPAERAERRTGWQRAVAGVLAAAGR
jgi:glycerol kinase